MSIWVIIIAIGVGWAIGPLALQLLGAGLACMTLLSLATRQPVGWATALVIGGGGVLMLYVGFQWKVARLSRYPTPIGVKARELAAGVILRPNPHSAVRRWLAGRVARALGPVQVAGPLDEAARSQRQGWAAKPRFEERPSFAEAEWIDGTAHEVNEPGPTGAEREADVRQRFREEVDHVLEDTRDCLEPIIKALFSSGYENWPDRLTEHRSQRRPELPRIQPGEGALHDRRLLFSVIAYDWTLIGSNFKRDPSPPARRLCAIANRYAHEGPLKTDAAEAREGFGEILDALRPQAIETAKAFMKHSRPLAHY